MKKYVCNLCGVEYDPVANNNVAFEDLPDDWVCPTCGAPKSSFSPVEEDDSAAVTTGGADMSMWQCQTNNCGYIYNPAKGDRKGRIAKGVAFEDLPDDWVCPVCGATKKMFVKLG